MATNINKFRLLRLPLLARENVLQTMECLDVITISHCSKNFKLFVKSLKIKSKLLHLTISNEIVVDIGVRIWPELVFLLEETGNPLDAPCKLGVHQEAEMICKITSLTIRDWLNYFFEIFHFSKLTLLFLRGSEVFDVENLQNTFRGLTITTLNLKGAGLQDSHSIKLMETFLPVENFGLYKNPFPNNATLQKAICEYEFKRLQFLSRVHVTLNDIVVLNAIAIEIWCCFLSENDLNVLFKVWKNGWNPKIKYLYMKIHREFLSDDYEANIIDGLGAVKNEEEYFIDIFHVRREPVKGGYDIKKKDGTNGTILFSVYGQCVDVHFMIGK
ncbi:unnamed protein product [Caenorhabditis brenneri]